MKWEKREDGSYRSSPGNGERRGEKLRKVVASPEGDRGYQKVDASVPMQSTT